MAETLADVLRDVIGERGYATYRDAADDIGVSPGTLSKWLRGDAPNVDNAVIIARFLQVRPTDVLPLIAQARLARQRGGAAPLSGEALGTERQVLDDIQELLTRHGFAVQRGNRSVHVDLVAQRETEVLGVEVKRLSGRDDGKRMRDAIGAAVLFGWWAETHGHRDYRMAVVVNRGSTEPYWVDALASVGAVLVDQDDPDALLRVPPRDRLVHGNVVQLDRSRRETLTPAAHEGDPKKKGSKPARRPKPPIEPEGHA